MSALLVDGRGRRYLDCSGTVRSLGRWSTYESTRRPGILQCRPARRNSFPGQHILDILATPFPHGQSVRAASIRKQGR
jgi:hypothetical protein